MHVPVTGVVLYDFGIMALLLIAGLMIGIQGGSKWGYLLVLVAGYWGFLLARLLIHA